MTPQDEKILFENMQSIAQSLKAIRQSLFAYFVATNPDFVKHYKELFLKDEKDTQSTE